MAKKKEKKRQKLATLEKIGKTNWQKKKDKNWQNLKKREKRQILAKFKKEKKWPNKKKKAIITKCGGKKAQNLGRFRKKCQK